MKPYRLAVIVLLAIAVTGLVGCSGNSSARTEADVFLSANLSVTTADVNMNVLADVTNQTVAINSHAKNSGATLSSQDDAILTDWVFTYSRTDGGTVASPEWRYSDTVYVPAAGSAPLNNYRIFPASYFSQPPLNQLLIWPYLDKETNNPDIRQRVHVAIYGKTVSGKSLSVEWDQTLNFYYTP
jgi:hypothetical protein